MPVAVDEKAWSTINFNEAIFTKDDLKATNNTTK